MALRTPDWTSEDGRHALYLGDCLEILPTLEAGSVDAVVTDPPYGMGWKGNQRFSGGNTRRGKGTRHEMIAGDDRPFDPTAVLSLGVPCVIWGANHFWTKLPPAACLVWQKKNNHALGTFLSDAEIAYMSKGYGVYVFVKTFSGSSRAVDAGLSAYAGSVHPNQKPVALMDWAMDRLGVQENQIVLDAFMGSGTTGVACVNTNRRFIGIEKEPKYFDIAVKRIQTALNARSELLIPA